MATTSQAVSFLPPAPTSWNLYGGDQNLLPFSTPNKPTQTTTSNKKAIYDTGRYSTDKAPDLLKWLNQGSFLMNFTPFGGSFNIANPSKTSMLNSYRGSFLDSGLATKQFNPTESSIITNPYGARATLMSVPWLNGNTPIYNQAGSHLKLNLLPGQSVDLSTGRLDNPNMHADTARRLNDQMNARLARETDISRATMSNTTRGMASALSTLDDMYVGSFQTKTTRSAQLSQTAQVNQAGINPISNRTLLGRASGN